MGGQKVLVPTLRPSDIDNLGGPKRKTVRQRIRAAGAKFFLNPIDQVFAQLKHLLRKVAARTVETVCVAIGEILGAFTPTECTNYFRNSGYART
jgi:hypothetical protein